jgi:hypothetical protein
MQRLLIRLMLCLLIVIPFQFACAQLNSQVVIPNLQKHIQTLASDKFEGRETGQRGEQLSSDYIVKQFQEIGLAPKGVQEYLQAFPFTKNTKIGAKSNVLLDGVKLEVTSDFFPLAYSANSSAKGETVNVGFGIVAPKLNYNDYESIKNLRGKIFVMEISTPDHAGPHSKYDESADIRTRIDSAIAKGAIAVIFINSDKDYTYPKPEYKNRITPSTIPVVFIYDKEGKLSAKDKSHKVEISTELIKELGTGHNVIGYLNNGATNTVIVGAHYDHLGFGGDESLYRGEPKIHNGADDNASGTAALIELARYLKAVGSKNNNYLFIAFSGEEKGLLGSGYFVKNPTVDLSKINYMLNMDMVGRLKPEDPTLLVNGVGTSDAWKVTMSFIKVDSLKIKTTESGVGPSDHTSFYLKDIPVLHFFSGTHSDYHKPSDDEPLINYNGEFRILNYMIQLITHLDDKGKINFIKTKDDTNEEAPRFKVTLGVIPDYAFDGEGMRIDGISEGRPAAKAGLKAGDVVVAIGENKVLDMTSYMKALGKFNKGDKAEVTVLREKKEMKVEVTF